MTTEPGTTYTFTVQQLQALLVETARLAMEYQDKFSHDVESAAWAASIEAIDGLDLERELFADSKIPESLLGQVIMDITDDVCISRLTTDEMNALLDKMN